MDVSNKKDVSYISKHSFYFKFKPIHIIYEARMKWKSFHLVTLSIFDSSYEGGGSTSMSEMIKLSWKKEYKLLKEKLLQEKMVKSGYETKPFSILKEVSSQLFKCTCNILVTYVIVRPLVSWYLTTLQMSNVIKQ